MAVKDDKRLEVLFSIDTDLLVVATTGYEPRVVRIALNH